MWTPGVTSLPRGQHDHGNGPVVAQPAADLQPVEARWGRAAAPARSARVHP